jgi:hypothetical protein
MGDLFLLIFVLGTFATIGYGVVKAIRAFREGLSGKPKPKTIYKAQAVPKPQLPPTPIAAKQKGDDFEKFIIKKFNPKFYHIKEWRGDKFVDGLYAETNKDPDIVLEYSWKGRQQAFAIECKYRSYSYQGTVDWAKERQVQHYQAFAARTNMPTFLILGVEGTSDHPKRIFVVPITIIQHHILSEQELLPFERKGHGDFFFNINTLHLS